MASVEATAPPMIDAAALRPLTHPAFAGLAVRHGFFTREGGVSTGLYASLNAGLGSDDAREAVVENKRRVAHTLGVAPDRLQTMHQVHSAKVRAIDGPLAERPRLDGLVTATPGLALAALAADCAPLLFADPCGVVGAAHAGWRGAVGGIVEATVAAMVGLGARPETITLVIGPTIRQPSYEVGPEFRDHVGDADAARAMLVPAERPGHYLFDLPGLIALRAKAAGVGTVGDLGLDTYADEARFYSFRRATHRSEPDYGRLISAIVLEG